MNNRVGFSIGSSAIAFLLTMFGFGIARFYELSGWPEALLIGIPALSVLATLVWNIRSSRRAKRLRNAVNELQLTTSLFYGLREGKRMIQQEPWTYVSLVEASNHRSFAGYKVYDRAVTMFEDHGLQALFDRGVVEYVDLALKAIYRDDDMLSTELGRAFVARGADAARKHGAENVLRYGRALGMGPGLDALEAGIPLEYAEALA